jgi:hypothetical protein
MSTTNTAWQPGAEDLARARKMIQNILQDWDWIPWDELLANDVVLSVKMESIGIDALQAVDGNLQVVGRGDAKRVLRSIYGDIKSGLSVTAEILSGYDVALLGNLNLPSTKEGVSSKSSPIVIYMDFTSEGEIQAITIAVIDLQPLADEIRNAAQKGTLKAA